VSPACPEHRRSRLCGRRTFCPALAGFKSTGAQKSVIAKWLPHRDLSDQLTGVAPDCRFCKRSSSCRHANKRTRGGSDMLRPEIDFAGVTNASDEALMEAITHHRPEALNEFLSRHGSRIKSVIGSVVHEEGEADDVLQEILIQV